MKKKKLLHAKPFAIKVYGISSPEKGYKLVWSLGVALHFNFQKQTKQDQINRYQHLKHDVFKTQSSEYETLILLENEKDGELFLPKYKIADFFLVHYIDGSKSRIDNILPKIKMISSVQAVFPIEFKNDKDEALFYLDV